MNRSQNVGALRWFKLALALAAWTLLGLLDGVQSYLSYAVRGQPLLWSQAAAFGLALWYAWALLSIFIFWFTRHYPIEHRQWPERLVLHLAAGIFFALVKLCMDYPIIEYFYCPAPGLTPFRQFFNMGLSSHFHPYILIYWAIVGVWHAQEYYSKYREREQNSARLDHLLTQARLHLLNSQIRPHFLFNTLNAIATLIHKDVELADRMIVRLGELLRTTLDHFDSREVSLREELAFTRSYLDIEQVRYGDSLRIDMEIDEATLEARVPFFLLQPLVENAIHHGIGPNGSPGRVLIESRLAGRTVRLSVEDTGSGCSHPREFKERVGLSNPRARLRQLFGDHQSLELGHSRLGGLAVMIEFPLVPQQSNSQDWVDSDTSQATDVEAQHVS